MSVFVVAHGAWSAGWAWKKMRPLLRALGHEVYTPTYTGLGERIHLASRDVGLDTHIDDVLGVLEYEDLRDVVLVGHSYGGMVATGVAERASRRLSQLVYLDAFVPGDGESLLDLLPSGMREKMREAARAEGESWRVPPTPVPSDTPEADRAWIAPRRFMHPLKALEQPVHLSGAVDTLRRTYIYCTRPGPGDPFRRFAERARTEAGWHCVEIDSSHNPHITVPEKLAAMLDDIACVSTEARP